MLTLKSKKFASQCQTYGSLPNTKQRACPTISTSLLDTSIKPKVHKTLPYLSLLTTEVGRETTVLHEGSRNPYTSIIENTHTHTHTAQTLNTKNYRLMKPYGKQYNHTNSSKSMRTIHNLPVNAETHSGGNDVHSREKLCSSEGRTKGSGSKSSA